MSIILGVLLSILLILLISYLIFGIIAESKGAPFVPSNSKRIEKMLDMVELKPGEKLVDLGSGDGRIVFAAAKRGTQSYGVDVNLILILWSNLLQLLTGNKLAKFEYKNLFDVDLSQFDVVTLYCLPRTINKLEEKFKKELKPGSRIVSNTFVVTNALKIKEDGKIKVYIY